MTYTVLVLIGFGPLCLYRKYSREINLGFSFFLFFFFFNFKAFMTLNYALFSLFTTIINIATCPAGWHGCALLSNFLTFMEGR